jgi:RNA polymerase sigma factor (sigma-70 family)
VTGEEDPATTGMTAAAPSFATFHASSRSRLARALAVTLGDEHLGAEAADEAMARAFQRWAKVGGYDNPAGWTYRVGLNWALSSLRRRRRAPRPLHEPSVADPTPMIEPDVLLALAELHVNQRAVVVCRYLLGLSEAQTAAALGTPPGTVKSRLHRANTHLKIRLAHLAPEDPR